VRGGDQAAGDRDAAGALLHAGARASDTRTALWLLPPPPPRAQIWKCSQDQSNHIVHEFFKSDHFNDGIPVIPGACVSRGAPGGAAP
jgi:hypothetical protein